MAFRYDSTKADTTIATGPVECTIKVATHKVAEKSGNDYINLKWEDVDGNEVWDKLVFAPTRGATARVNAFIEAIGRSVAQELDGRDIDQAFLVRWAESLLGESATLEVEMKWSDYRNASEPNVKWYRPIDSITTADDLLDLDESL